MTTPSSNLTHQYQNGTLAVLADAIGSVLTTQLAEGIAALGESWQLGGEGIWLDYLGQRLGLTRPQTATGSFFGFDDAGVAFDQAGFVSTAARHAVSVGVADEIYRRFLLARARYITGAADGETIAAILAIIYGAGRVEDDGSLDVILHVPSSPPTVLHGAVQTYIEQIIPRPAGVSYTLMADL